MNALLGKDRAIVTDIPGTTRDTLEDELHLGSMHFRLIDTAGIRQSIDPDRTGRHPPLAHGNAKSRSYFFNARRQQAFIVG